jgi:hypothetical protein
MLLQASYVVAGGHVPTILDAVVQPTVFTFAFHSAAFNVTIDPYHPPLFQSASIAGCNGTAALTLTTWQHVVQLDMLAAPGSFAAVTCPNKDGFMVSPAHVTRYRWCCAACS